MTNTAPAGNDNTPVPPWWARPWTIFWVAFGLRVACILIGHTYRIQPINDHFRFGFEMGRIARSLVEGHGYGNPFNGASGPTAWVMPLYPLLLALAFKLFGVYSAGAAIFVLVVNSAFSAAIAPAVYEIGQRCFDAYGIARRQARHSAPVAVWAAWMWAAYPAALQYAIHWIWEMSVSTCLFTWAVVLALRLRRVGDLSRVRTFFDSDLAYSHADEPLPQQPGIGTWLAFGLLWGLTLLSNASLLLCLPAMLLWILWPLRRTPGVLLPQLTRAVLSCVVIAACMAPWIVRNERTMHAFIPTRSNFGAEFDESLKAEHQGLPYTTVLPLWTGDPDFQRYLHNGEVAYARERMVSAKARLHANPGRFLGWSLDRFLWFWDGTPHPVEHHPEQEYLRQLSYSFLSVCGVLGLLLALKRRVPGAGLMGLIFLCMPLLYYFVIVQPRFRHPLEPLIAVLAVYLFRATEPRKQPASL